ncbi:MAG: MMPL family transporter [Mycobacterium sp.]
MTAALYRLGLFCVRARWPIVIAWVLLVVVLGVGVVVTGPRQADDLTVPGSDSAQATALLQERYPSGAQEQNPIVVRAPDGSALTAPSTRSALESTVLAARSAPNVASVSDPYTTPGGLSADQSTAVIVLSLQGPVDGYTANQAQAAVDAIQKPLQGAGLETAVGGSIGEKLYYAQSVRGSDNSSSWVGIVFALLILLLTFGSVTSMLLPIVNALFGLMTGLSAIMLLSHVAVLPTAAPALASMIGLGVGIDYSMFILARHREQIAEGMGIPESIARSVATSGAAVVFAGVTVILALCSLAVTRLPLVRSMGMFSAVAVVTAILAAVTLMPALLAIAGSRVDSLRLPWARTGAGDHRGWERWGRLIADHPWPAAIASTAVLLFMAIPVLSLDLGQIDTAAAPKNSQIRIAYDMIAKGFGPGANGPLIIAVGLPGTPTDDGVLARLEQRLSAEPDVVALLPANVNAARTAAVLEVIPRSPPQAEATANLVRRIRSQTIPQALGGTGLVAHVGGITAAYIDVADAIQDTLVESILVVVLLSFLLLIFAFRSPLIAAKAALMNLLAVGAAYGMLVAVFQWGWGTRFIGLSGEVPITSFVPVLMFAILFGLSMDYEVFLVSHIKEEHEAGAQDKIAAIRGLARSARVITSAALIMVSVFGAFILSEDPTIKQFGLGLAFAVALDATVVRCVLVPALMVLAGRANWWLPGWLDRILPRGGVEGTEYFRTDTALS